MQSGMSELLEQSGVRITPHMHEQYIKLMCMFNPENVYSYLVQQDNYPLEPSLMLVKKAGLTDATVYLLEKMGDVTSALNLLLTPWKSQLEELQKAYDKALTAAEATAEKTIQKILNDCISLCQRNFSKLGDGENETLWFKLLDIIVEPHRQFREQIKTSEKATEGVRKTDRKLTEFMQTVLSSMMSSVALPSILNKIVKDHGKDEFGDFKFIILGMLDTYTYETTILKIVNKLITRDMFSAENDLVKKRTRGLRPTNRRCSMCSRSFLDKTESNLVIFHCGHSYHKTCIPVQSDTGKSLNCPICTGSTMTDRTPTSKKQVQST